MKSVFLSYYVNNNTPQYGGDDAIAIYQRSSIAEGDSSNSKQISMPNHVSTHIDFPRHFSIDGKTLNDYPADYWIFRHPFVLEYAAADEEIIDLSENLLESIPSGTDILFINTGFQKNRGAKKYWNNNPGLSPGLAVKLRERCPDLKIVGFDFISLSSYQNRMLGREAHKEFLVKNDILVIEDMDFKNLKKGVSRVVALPFMIDQADGGPITVIASYE